MDWLFGDTPEPPNPYVTAGLQTGTNIGTAVANQQLNQTNQITPEGSLTYSQTGTFEYRDPATGVVHTLPKTTAVQELSPQNKLLKAEQDATKLSLATMAHSQANRVSSLLGSEMDFSGAPGAGDASRIGQVPGAVDTYDTQQGGIQRQLGDAGQLTRDYGPADNFSADRQRVESALYDRMNPQLQRERGNIEQRLADQGIRYGSQAYKDAMSDYSRQANDMRLGVTVAGGAEQQRMNQMAAERAAFQNAAQQQGFQQLLGRGTFANQAQNQQVAQNAGAAAFMNAARQQQLGQQQSLFNANQAQRSAWMNEQYARRNQPINEISSLMSGSQINQPNFINAPTTQIPTTDVAGQLNTNFAQQMQASAQQNQAMQSLIGGAIQGAGNIYASDKRVKKDIKQIGTVFAHDVNKDKPKIGSVIGEKKELPIFNYKYKGDPSGATHTGPMAQDVEKLDKDAVHDIGGVKHLDRRRVMGNILRAA